MAYITKLLWTQLRVILLSSTEVPLYIIDIQATERFEAIYPILKEVALAGVPGSKAMKQVSQQTFTFDVKAVGQGIPELSREWMDIFICCLIRQSDSHKKWVKGLASVVVALGMCTAFMSRRIELFDWEQLFAFLNQQSF